MVDYHAWDNIELSDDDCERLAHPNVDQGSLERWLRIKYYDKIDEEKEHLKKREEDRKHNLEELEDLQKKVKEVPLEEKEKIVSKIEEKKKYEEERKKEDEEFKKHPKWNIETICQEKEDVSVINWTPKEELELTPEQFDTFLKLKTLQETQIFINTHGPKVLKENMVQKCLQKAWENLWDRKKKLAKLAIRQSLIIQYCLAFCERGDGVYWFFKRLQSPYQEYARDTFEEELEERFKLMLEQYNQKKKQIETSVDDNGEPIYQTIDIPETSEQSQNQQHTETSQQHIETRSSVEELTPDQELELRRQEAFKKFPKELQDALNSGNDEDLNAFFEKLEYENQEEYERIINICNDLGIIQRKEAHLSEDPEQIELQRKRNVFQSLPKNIQQALLNKDTELLNELIQNLPSNEGHEVTEKLIDVGLISRPQKSSWCSVM